MAIDRAGPVVATLLGEIPDIHKFNTAKQFVAFIGLDASVNIQANFAEPGCTFPSAAVHTSDAPSGIVLKLPNGAIAGSRSSARGSWPKARIPRL